MTELETPEFQPSFASQIDEIQDRTAPIHPQPAPDSMLNPPPPLHRVSSMSGDSVRSMRTSSFAMSDVSDTKSLSHSESLRIRKAYAKPIPWVKLSTLDNAVPETETVDYFDEKDFRDTDRYNVC